MIAYIIWENAPIYAESGPPSLSPFLFFFFIEMRMRGPEDLKTRGPVDLRIFGWVMVLSVAPFSLQLLIILWELLRQTHSQNLCTFQLTTFPLPCPALPFHLHSSPPPPPHLFHPWTKPICIPKRREASAHKHEQNDTLFAQKNY